MTKQMTDNVMVNVHNETCSITIGSCNITYDKNNQCMISCPCVNIVVNDEIRIGDVNHCKKSVIDDHLIINDKDNTDISVVHDTGGHPIKLYLQKDIVSSLNKEEVIGILKYSCFQEYFGSNRFSHYHTYVNFKYGADDSRSQTRLLMDKFLRTSLEEANEKIKKKYFETYLKGKYNVPT